MSRRLERSDAFREDFALQALWYVRQGEAELGRRYQRAVEATLQLLLREPEIGRRRGFRHPKLAGLRSMAVQRPFSNLIIFYRVNDSVVQLWRLLHGARDLPRRLRDGPGL